MPQYVPRNVPQLYAPRCRFRAPLDGPVVAGGRWWLLAQLPIKSTAVAIIYTRVVPATVNMAMRARVQATAEYLYLLVANNPALRADDFNGSTFDCAWQLHFFKAQLSQARHHVPSVITCSAWTTRYRHGARTRIALMDFRGSTSFFLASLTSLPPPSRSCYGDSKCLRRVTIRAAGGCY